MKFPAYTDDVYWTNVIKQYIQNNNKHPEWYNIEYYMWEYFKNCLKGIIVSFLNIHSCRFWRASLSEMSINYREEQQFTVQG